MKHLRNLNGENSNTNNNAAQSEISFVKIEFYGNEKIKNIYIPNGFYEQSMTFIE